MSPGLFDWLFPSLRKPAPPPTPVETQKPVTKAAFFSLLPKPMPPVEPVVETPPEPEVALAPVLEIEEVEPDEPEAFILPPKGYLTPREQEDWTRHVRQARWYLLADLKLGYHEDVDLDVDNLLEDLVLACMEEGVESFRLPYRAESPAALYLTHRHVYVHGNRDLPDFTLLWAEDGLEDEPLPDRVPEEEILRLTQLLRKARVAFILSGTMGKPRDDQILDVALKEVVTTCRYYGVSVFQTPYQEGFAAAASLIGRLVQGRKTGTLARFFFTWDPEGFEDEEEGLRYKKPERKAGPGSAPTAPAKTRKQLEAERDARRRERVSQQTPKGSSELSGTVIPVNRK